MEGLMVESTEPNQLDSSAVDNVDKNVVGLAEKDDSLKEFADPLPDPANIMNGHNSETQQQQEVVIDPSTGGELLGFSNYVDSSSGPASNDDDNTRDGHARDFGDFVASSNAEMMVDTERVVVDNEIADEPSLEKDGEEKEELTNSEMPSDESLPVSDCKGTDQTLIETNDLSTNHTEKGNNHNVDSAPVDTLGDDKSAPGSAELAEEPHLDKSDDSFDEFKDAEADDSHIVVDTEEDRGELEGSETPHRASSPAAEDPGKQVGGDADIATPTESLNADDSSQPCKERNEDDALMDHTTTIAEDSGLDMSPFGEGVADSVVSDAVEADTEVSGEGRETYKITSSKPGDETSGENSTLDDVVSDDQEPTQEAIEETIEGTAEAPNGIGVSPGDVGIDIAAAEVEDVDESEVASNKPNGFENVKEKDAREEIAQNGGVGEFGSPTEAENGGLALEPSNNESPEVDDFGDFESFEKPTVDSTEPQDGTVKTLESAEHDFGDFETSAQPAVSEGTGGEEAADTASQLPDENKGDMDDFGAFDGAPLAEHDVEEEPGGSVLQNAEEDAFGEFASSSEQDNKLETSSLGGIESESAAPRTGDNNDTADDAQKAGESAEAEDEFGDFGSFSDPNVSTKSSPLGEAEPLSASQETSPATGDLPAEDDDEFGEFGDFASGSPGEAALPHSSVEQPRSAPAPDTIEGAPLSQNAKIVFCNVFGSNLDIDNSNDDEAGAQNHERVRVQQIMSSCPPRGDRINHTWSTNALSATLADGVGTEDKPSAILADCCVHAYSPFSFLIGGMSASEAEFREGIKKRQEQTPSRRVVPDVLSIELPDGKDATRARTTDDTTEDNQISSSSQSTAARKLEYDTKPSVSNAVDRASGRSAQPDSSTSATIVTLPPEKSRKPHRDQGRASDAANGLNEIASGDATSVTRTDANEGLITESARRLIGQIPDLSFMLKSTFCPPRQGDDLDKKVKQEEKKARRPYSRAII